MDAKFWHSFRAETEHKRYREFLFFVFVCLNTLIEEL